MEENWIFLSAAVCIKQSHYQPIAVRNLENIGRFSKLFHFQTLHKILHIKQIASLYV